MRILALETDIEVLKKKFLAEGEQAALVTHRHIFACLLSLIWKLPLSIAALSALLVPSVQEFLGSQYTTLFLWVWFIVTVYILLAAYVAWKCNFIIVTTQKVVLIEQRSFFYQKISPIPFTSISNTRVESRFFGFFRCGTLYLITRVTELGGQFNELMFTLLPKADDVGAVIENGLTVSKKLMDTEEEQKRKEIMQEPAIVAGNPEPETLPEEQKK